LKQQSEPLFLRGMQFALSHSKDFTCRVSHPPSTSFRALLPAVAVVALGAAAFAAGRESQRASMATPLTICSTETEAAFPAETPYLAENDTAMNKMIAEGHAEKPGRIAQMQLK
jgi:hypothetical protein